MDLYDLVPIIQMSIGPVILISGVGLLLLSMTNRLARVIDRSRELTRTPDDNDEAVRITRREQVEILYSRSRILRAAIIMAGLSVLFGALLIISLFVAALVEVNLIVVIAFLFTASLLSLVGSVIKFLRDVNLSLRALDLEIGTDDTLP